MKKVIVSAVGIVTIALAMTIATPSSNALAFKPAGNASVAQIRGMQEAKRRQELAAWKARQRAASIQRLRNAFNNLRQRSDRRGSSRRNPSWNSAVRWDSKNGSKGYRNPTQHHVPRGAGMNLLNVTN